VRYSREDGCLSWLTYGLLGADKTRELLKEYGSAEEVYDQFIRTGGSFLKKHRITDTAIGYLKDHASNDAMHTMMITLQQLDIGILTENDPQYPDSLREIDSPPAILFYRGNPDCVMGKCVTIIGSRKCSPQGERATVKISRQLSEAGIVIVSGLAMGIDTAAHRGCLEGGSPTAAVLACGMDVDYPAENSRLSKRILESGGVLFSEYPLGFRANKHVFSVRNRIMSALGCAVIMMEAPIKSGCMLTVHHALEQGRDVYAYPGIPDTVWSEGAHHLLRDGAIYFTSASDILEDLKWESKKPVAAMADIQAEYDLPPLADDQRKVYSILCSGEKTFDELVYETGLTATEISAALTMLQIMGLINANHGNSYSKA